MTPREPQPGDKMPDGSVYAGVSPDTGHPLYVVPADTPLYMQFNSAASYAKDLDAHGHHDWRLPTRGELDILFNNRAAIGGFNQTGDYPQGSYWSCQTQDDPWIWTEKFNYGAQDILHKDQYISTRCVRSLPKEEPAAPDLESESAAEIQKRLHGRAVPKLPKKRAPR